MDTENTALALLPENFCHEAKVFYLMPNSVQENEIPVTKYFFLKNPFGPRERSFHSLAELFSQKTHILPHNVRKWKKMEKFQLRCFSWNWSHKHWQCSFDNIAQSFYQEAKVFYIMPKRVQESNFPLTKHIFLERSLWTRRTQFWQPCRTVETRDPYFSAEWPKMGKRKKQLQNRYFSWKGSSGRWECSSDSSARKVSQSSRISLAQCQNALRKIIFLRRQNIIYSKDSL